MDVLSGGLRLRPLHPDDLTAVLRWAADAEFCRANGWRVGLSEGDLTRWLAPILAGQEPHFLRLGVELAGQLIGFVDLADLNPHSAEFGIALGERRLWGRGLGERAGQLMLAHGFGTLGLRLIRASVHVTNARSLGLMARLGFRDAGLSPEQEMYRGEWTRVQLFELRAEDSGFGHSLERSVGTSEQSR